MPEMVIDAERLNRQYVKDLWNYRELGYFLAWRDIKVMYKQTIVGLAWTLIRPLLTMVVFTVIFGRLAKLPVEGNAPYAIMVFSATLPWQFFASSLASASESLIANANMVSKVYFPRILAPMSSVVVALVDFCIAFCILLLLMLGYWYAPTWKIVFLPFFLIFAAMAALGLGFWLAALNVKYRDFRYIVPFFVQFGLYVSPVGFSSQIVPDHFRLLFSLNPMVGVIDGFRWAILGAAEPYVPGMIVSMIVVTVLFVSGAWFFRRMEKVFADFI